MVRIWIVCLCLLQYSRTIISEEREMAQTPKQSKLTSIKCVRPILIIFLYCNAIVINVSFNCIILGINDFVVAVATAMYIAVGNESLLLCQKYIKKKIKKDQKKRSKKKIKKKRSKKKKKKKNRV